jgi:hypothetical protein
MFLYTTNQLIDGGAETMVEIVRQPMLDLQKKLSDIGYTLPRKATFQFDNCGRLLMSFYFKCIWVGV